MDKYAWSLLISGTLLVYIGVFFGRNSSFPGWFAPLFFIIGWGIGMLFQKKEKDKQ